MIYAISMYLDANCEAQINCPNAPADAIFVRVMNHRGVNGINGPWKRVFEVQKETTKVFFTLHYSHGWNVTHIKYHPTFDVLTKIEVNCPDKADEMLLRIRNLAGDLDPVDHHDKMTEYEVYRYIARAFSYYQG